VECATMLVSGWSETRYDDGDSQTLQSFGTVLGLASSRVGSTLVKRLIDQGANVHAKEQYHHDHSSAFWQIEMPSDATALHISSMYWNTEVMQTLVDHGGTKALSCRDSNGRLPLHWAAAGPGSFECWLPDVKINNRIIGALKLLCSSSDINARDNNGETPLYHAVEGHAGCGQSIHFDNVLNFFLENGARASRRQ